MGDHKFAWVLGAGASKSSGIPLGSELVDRWLREIHIKECVDKSLLKSADLWATEETLGEGFRSFAWERRAAYYSQVFKRRFRDYPIEGYAYLEKVMTGKEPSPGYSILAAAMSGQAPRPKSALPHNVVITTNFDNLVGDAISIYTNTFPLVCGHESLAGFAAAGLTRPLICKIHRDLLFSPQNDPRSLARLKDSWATALTRLFESYTPLFIGYGGNDDTLMDLLRSLEPGSIKGQLIWTYHEKSAPSEQIRQVVAQHDGALVPVPDFDLLMLLLGERMGIALLDDQIQERADARISRYRQRIESLDVRKFPSVFRAFKDMTRRSGRWWAWARLADTEATSSGKEQILLEGINQLNGSPDLTAHYARLLSKDKKRSRECLQLFKDAVASAPNNPGVLCMYAEFLKRTKKGHPEAGRLYARACELAPSEPDYAATYAFFLAKDLRNHELAEVFCKKSIQPPSSDYAYRVGYAGFLLGRGRVKDALRVLSEGEERKEGMALAVSVVYLGIISRIDGRSDRVYIERLQEISRIGIQQESWWFDGVFRIVRRKLSPQDSSFYIDLLKALADPAVKFDASRFKNKTLKTRAKKSSTRKRSGRVLRISQNPGTSDSTPLPEAG